jgi:hypothetical protein
MSSFSRGLSMGSSSQVGEGDFSATSQPAFVVYGVYTMERYQIYIDREQRERLDKLAGDKGCKLSQVIRTAIDEYIDRHENDAPAPLKNIEDHPLWKFIETIDADVDPDAPVTYGSTTYKEALYGGKRPWPESS